jgi:hypothetical protein
MKRLLAIGGLAVLTSLAQARPVEYTESARITRFDTTHTRFGHQVAIDGGWALVRADRGDSGVGLFGDSAVFLYRRQSAGNWVLDRQLTPWEERTEWTDPGLAMKNGIAVVNTGGTAHVFELIAGQWVEQPVVENPQGFDLEIHGRRMLSGSQGCWWHAFVHEENASGSWVRSAQLDGYYATCGDNAISQHLDLSDDAAIVSNPWTDEPQLSPIPVARVFRRVSGTWQHEIDLPRADRSANYAWDVALRGDDAFVTGVNYRGAHHFKRSSTGTWSRVGRLDTVESFMSTNVLLEKSPDFVLQKVSRDDDSREAVHVFRENASGRYQHVAILSRRDGGFMGDSFDISGQRVIVAAHDNPAHPGVSIFELPASIPAAIDARQDSFESGNAGADWSPTAGSQFSIATVNGQRVYRQTSLAGEAASVWQTPGSLGNQSIQAEITPRAFAQNGRWVGLMTRYSDPNNYYYVTLRYADGLLELKRKVNGVFTSLASEGDFPVEIDRMTRVRLESIGGRHRVYVNDMLRLQAEDHSLTEGRAGVVMYRAAADYDNVIVSPSTHSRIFNAGWYGNPHLDPWRLAAWRHTGSGSWAMAPDVLSVYRQSSTTAEARAITGMSTDDQIVTGVMRATAFGTGSPWFGVMLRYVDDQNYVYVSLRQGNRLSLRQLVDGQVQVLSERTFPVELNRRYFVRVEMVDGATRVFVDGVHQLSAGDIGPRRGQVGLMTYRSAVEFDYFDAHQP